MRSTHSILIVLAFLIWTCGPDASLAPDGDRQVIQQLQQAGSDLSKPHRIEFFLYFPSHAAAQQTAARLRESGFAVQVQPGADTPDYLCLATKEIVPDHQALVAIRSDFTDLAAELGGEYDGWGTPTVH